ncbi:Hsp70 family protein [Rhodococcus phenolicus]|uniref:Hsp70 family protein n=1 Tax=Rhodococcus phenolicus TaxID=263849 RepID=UPI00082CB249|nr:Hsp70 family protein [Rhodococcus phenolicus]
MTAGLGVTIGSANAVAAATVLERPDDPTVLRRATTVRLHDDGTAELGHGSGSNVFTGFVGRVGDPVGILSADGTSWTGEDLTATAVSCLLHASPPHGAVTVTHPAMWAEHTVDALRGALDRAGLHGATLMPEPVAAVHWLDSAHGPLGDGVVVVYDLGAHSLDVTVLRTGGEPELLGRPLSSDELSGDVLDHLVTTHVLDAVGDVTGDLDLFDPGTVGALAELRARCRGAKEELSADTDVVVTVELPGVRRDVRLVRDEVEELVRGPVRDSLPLISEALRTADVDPSDVSRVLLVGGGSSIPLVAESISFELGLPVTASANPADTVAAGAALVSARSLATSGAAIVAPDPADDAITTELSVVTPPPGAFARPAIAAGEPVEPLRSKARKFALIGAAAAAIVVVTGGGLAVGTLTTSAGEAGAESARSSTVVAPTVPTTAGEPTSSQATVPGGATHAAATASTPATPGSAVPVLSGTMAGTAPAAPGAPAPTVPGEPAPGQPATQQPAPQQPVPAPTTTQPPVAPQQPSGGGVGEAAEGIGNGVGGAVEGVGTGLGGAVEGVGNGLGGVLEGTGNAVGGLLGGGN